MYAGEDGEVCVELGYLGKGLSTFKAEQPDKSKAGGLPVRVDGNRIGALIYLCVTIRTSSNLLLIQMYPMLCVDFDSCLRTFC